MTENPLKSAGLDRMLRLTGHRTQIGRQMFHYLQHWLAADPPGTNHLIAAVIGVAIVWVAFERFASGMR